LLKGNYKKTIFNGHKGGIYALKSHGDTLVTASGDKSIRIWNMTTGECTHILNGHTSGVCCISYDDVEKIIVSGSWDKTIRVWNLKNGESKILRAHVNGVRCLQVKGNKMISGASDKIIFVWNLAQGQCELILKGHEAGVYCLEFSGNKLISGSGDATMRVWDLTTGQCTKILKGHTGDVYCLKFHRNLLVSGSGDKTLRVWDLESGEFLRNMQHPDSVYTVDLDNRNSLVITGCGDNRIRMWDLKSAECLRVINAHMDGIYSLQLDDDMILTGSIDKTASRWQFFETYDSQ